MRRFIAAALAWAACVAAVPVGPNLFIAGEGFTIEQALADARSQRTPLDAAFYKVLVTGSEVPRLVSENITSDVAQLVADAQRHGARFFVCAKDLVTLGATPGDLLPGVQAVRGYRSRRDRDMPAWVRTLPPAPDRKAMSVCSS